MSTRSRSVVTIHHMMSADPNYHVFQLPVYGGGYAAPPNHGYGAPPPSYGLYGAPPPVHYPKEPANVVCRDMIETVCNTSTLGRRTERYHVAIK